MPFLSPNQQRQSTEGKLGLMTTFLNKSVKVAKTVNISQIHDQCYNTYIHTHLTALCKGTTYMQQDSFLQDLINGRWTTTTTTTIPQPLCTYRSTCVNRYLQLRTGGFCWCKILLPVCPCWRQPAHSDREKRMEFSSTVLSALSPNC